MKSRSSNAMAGSHLQEMSHIIQPDPIDTNWSEAFYCGINHLEDGVGRTLAQLRAPYSTHLSFTSSFGFTSNTAGLRELSLNGNVFDFFGSGFGLSRAAVRTWMNTGRSRITSFMTQTCV